MSSLAGRHRRYPVAAAATAADHDGEEDEARKQKQQEEQERACYRSRRSSRSSIAAAAIAAGLATARTALRLLEIESYRRGLATAAGLFAAHAVYAFLSPSAPALSSFWSTAEEQQAKQLQQDSCGEDGTAVEIIAVEGEDKPRSSIPSSAGKPFDGGASGTETISWDVKEEKKDDDGDDDVATVVRRPAAIVPPRISVPEVGATESAATSVTFADRKGAEAAAIACASFDDGNGDEQEKENATATATAGLDDILLSAAVDDTVGSGGSARTELALTKPNPSLLSSSGDVANIKDCSCNEEADDADDISSVAKVEYLRRKIAALITQNGRLRADFKCLKQSNQRLKAASATAGHNFEELNRHIQQLSRANLQMESELAHYKVRAQQSSVTQSELKEEIHVKRETYAIEVQSRLRYQKLLADVMDKVQDRCRDARLVEELLSMADSCDADDPRHREMLG